MAFKAKNGRKWKHHWYREFYWNVEQYLGPVAKLISPNHRRYDVTGKPGQEFSEKTRYFYDSNMLIDVCTSFLGLSSSASQLGMVKHIKFDHILDTIFCWFWTESVQCVMYL